MTFYWKHGRMIVAIGKWSITVRPRAELIFQNGNLIWQRIVWRWRFSLYRRETL